MNKKILIGGLAGVVILGAVYFGAGGGSLKGELVVEDKVSIEFAQGKSNPSSSASSAYSQMVIAGFDVTTESPQAYIRRLQLSINPKNASVCNIKLFPQENDLDSSFALTPNIVGNNFNFDMAPLKEKRLVTAAAKRSYVIRGDVTSGTAATLDLKVTVSGLERQKDKREDFTVSNLFFPASTGTVSKAGENCISSYK